MAELERLLYTSHETEPMGTLGLFNLLNDARLRNVERGITGHLVYSEGVFTQCIEGAPASIERLWQSLQKDLRHQDLQILCRGPIEARRFGDWSMAFSSYRYLNSLNMSGFYPLDELSTNEQVQACQS